MADFNDAMPAQTPECFASHMVPWMILASYLELGRTLAIAGVKPTHAAIARAINPQAASSQDQENTSPVFITEDGIAVIGISGSLMKSRSKFGGTSTVDVRRQVRAMATSKDVRAIMLHIDSPGGTVAGTEELATDIQIAKQMKPVSAHFSDMGASAAFWIGSQADMLTANSTAMVGSLGTVAVLYDESKKAEMEGVRVKVISTGAFKGAGAPGAPITEAQEDDAQRLVNGLNEKFMAAVSAGRKMPRKDVDHLADGRVWLAEEAKAFGLIDGVMTFDQAMQQFRSTIDVIPAGISVRHRQAAAMILLSDI